MQDLRFIQADYEFRQANWILEDDEVEQVPKDALRLILKELRPLKQYAPNLRGWVQKHRGKVMIIVTLGRPLEGRAWPIYHSRYFQYVVFEDSAQYTPPAMALNFFKLNRNKLEDDFRALIKENNPRSRIG